MKNYIRHKNLIIDVETQCSKDECFDIGCEFPNCSKEFIELKTINEAKRKSSELQKDGHKVKRLDSLGSVTL